MTEGTMALDEAFDRMAGLDFELPNGFVNHGPMACEALAALDLDDQIEDWSRRFAGMLDQGPTADRPQSFDGTGWRNAFGDSPSGSGSSTKVSTTPGGHPLSARGCPGSCPD